MNDHTHAFADPWLKKAEEGARLPDDARFACAYELFVSFEHFDEAAFFRRTETTDEPWTGAGAYPPARAGTDQAGSAEDFERANLSHIGCVYAAARKGEESTSCLSLLDRLFRARVGFYWPAGFLAAGVVDEPAFTSLVGQIRHEFDDNSQMAREAETEIIKVAVERGLSPKPTGEGPNSWYAACPGGNHVLFISAATNSFGCGWCKRKGAIEELRAFGEEHKDGRTSREADRPLELPFSLALRSFLLRPVRAGCYAEKHRDRKQAGGRK
jgi:hypothetical protein